MSKKAKEVLIICNWGVQHHTRILLAVSQVHPFMIRRLYLEGLRGPIRPVHSRPGTSLEGVTFRDSASALASVLLFVLCGHLYSQPRRFSLERSHQQPLANATSDASARITLLEGLKIFFFILTQYVVLFHSQSSLESESHSFQLLETPWIYSPWKSPGQNTGVGSRSLLQGTFPTQGSNPGLLHCRWILWKTSWATREAPSSPANLWSIKVAGALFLGLYLFKFSKIKNVKIKNFCSAKEQEKTNHKLEENIWNRHIW